MQVEVRFADLDSSPLELRMSRSSPGRYSLHEFAKNVYDVRAFGADGREVVPSRPDPDGWTVAGHGGAATVSYKIYGDRVDGTYLAIDTTHAHINMPAALMWARGLDDRPASLVFEPPAGSNWRVATQLFPGSTPYEFTAPNLQYLMDSPVELGAGTIREFQVDGHRFRVSLHHQGTDDEFAGFVRDIEKIVREQGEIFGEYPRFEPGHYTFIADYLPYANGDGMEHRNSTIVTSSGTLRSNRTNLLGTASHEFFHGWNVERIRPRSLEPFDFERANMSGELWLGEGFTQYYGVLTLSRAGLIDLGQLAARMSGFIASVAHNPARLVRSAEEMSRLAPFTDGGQPVDRTNWSTTYISYYSQGAAIALALDLSLREKSGGAVSLDAFMRAMWRAHGVQEGGRPGYVDRPYTITDAEARLAEVSGDATFARNFFGRYVQGREVADYGRLLEHAGLSMRPLRRGRAWIGNVQLDDSAGAVRLTSPAPVGSPIHDAGLDLGDEIRHVDGDEMRSIADFTVSVDRRKPGDQIAVGFIDRTGMLKVRTLTLEEDPSFELLPIESAGGTMTAAQRTFRDGWLR
jgi:predicted metalloprotease with PDZ domain